MIGGRGISRLPIILARSGGLAAAATRSAHGHAVSRGRRTVGIGREGQGPRGRAAGEPRSANTRSRGSRGQPPEQVKGWPLQVFAERKV